MTSARYKRRFAKRSRRSRSQDLAKQARVAVASSDRSKRGRRLLSRWMRHPNQLDVRGVDTRRRGKRMVTKTTRRRTSRPRRRSSVVTPAPRRPLALPAPRGSRVKGTAARSVKAEVLRDFRKFRPTLTKDAYGKAQATMRSVLKMYAEDGPIKVSAAKRRGAIATIRSHFAREMQKRYKNFGPDWGRRPRQGRMVL